MPRRTPAQPAAHGRRRSSSPPTDPATGESSSPAISQVPESADPKTETTALSKANLLVIVATFQTLEAIGRIRRTKHVVTTDEDLKEDEADGHKLFGILEKAGVKIDSELATAIEDEVARIKAQGAREGANKKSGKKEKTWQRVIDDIASDIGYVLVHSACSCMGGIALLWLITSGARH